MKFDYKDTQWIEEQGGFVVDCKNGYRLMPSGAKFVNDRRVPPSPNPVARLQAQKTFYVLRSQDAQSDLDALQPLLAERERHRVLWPSHPMRHDFAWDAPLHGPKPACPESAAKRLRQIIAADRAAAGEIESRIRRQDYADAN